MSPLKTICITSGDIDGIGLEVSCKALLKVGPRPKFRFVLFLSDKKIGRSDALLMKKVRARFKTEEFSSLDDGLACALPQTNLVLVRSALSPAAWVEQSAQACLSKRAQAMCTAPLSKPGIRLAGFDDLGHTEILKRVCGFTRAHMGFFGRHFNVVLATGHLPVSEVSQELRFETLEFAISICEQVRKLLPAKIRSKPIGILGLNPHAGDSGLIGDFEKTVLKPTLDKLNKAGLNLRGPLVPDVAFRKDHWNQYSLYLAMYHDQGLIPFKLIHGFDSGVHLTLGLPICRTSVDHGTAKDIYSKNVADAGSMTDALLWALTLAKGNSYV